MATIEESSDLASEGPAKTFSGDQAFYRVAVLSPFKDDRERSTIEAFGRIGVAAQVLAFSSMTIPALSTLLQFQPHIIELDVEGVWPDMSVSRRDPMAGFACIALLRDLDFQGAIVVALRRAEPTVVGPLLATRLVQGCYVWGELTPEDHATQLMNTAGHPANLCLSPGILAALAKWVSSPPAESESYGRITEAPILVLSSDTKDPRTSVLARALRSRSPRTEDIDSFLKVASARERWRLNLRGQFRAVVVAHHRKRIQVTSAYAAFSPWPASRWSLTRSEEEVCRSVRLAMSQAEIAVECHVSLSAVRSRLRSAKKKVMRDDRGLSAQALARIALPDGYEEPVLHEVRTVGLALPEPARRGGKSGPVNTKS